MEIKEKERIIKQTKPRSLSASSLSPKITQFPVFQQFEFIWTNYLNTELQVENVADEWIGCTLSKFEDDTKLSGVVGTPERWDAIHRDLDKLEKWVYGNLMRFNETKHTVLHLSWDKPSYQPRLGDEQVESSPAEKGLGG
ncbi:rna-directed dna polymerase from mobile element jockey-like [Pitangus sulphuratus]|nr:rna-directed dna polymerase from mobile element jockey-like [Pitangus sulphuratus]